MRTIHYVIGLITALSLISTVVHPAEPGAPELYRAHEFQVDVSGFASTEDFDLGNVDYGAGVGVNYYISRQFGIGISGHSADRESLLVDQASVDVLARQPIGPLAPYLFLGGDYNFEIEEWFGHAGAGLELRFHRNVSTFVDARWETDFYTEGRAIGRGGIRLSF